jgi:Polyphosphate kinase 2 (PPK2)
MHTCPELERILVRDGIILRKYWFSVSDEEQERRFQKRSSDPTRRWKLSPMDLKSRDMWVAYSRAKDEMFRYTHTPEAPWYTVESDDKRRARLNCISHILDTIEYEDVIPIRSSYRLARSARTTDVRRATHTPRSSGSTNPTNGQVRSRHSSRDTEVRHAPGIGPQPDCAAQNHPKSPESACFYPTDRCAVIGTKACKTLLFDPIAPPPPKE